MFKAPAQKTDSVPTLYISIARHAVRNKCLLGFFSSRRRHTRCLSDWSSDVCSSDGRHKVSRTGLPHSIGGRGRPGRHQYRGQPLDRPHRGWWRLQYRRLAAGATRRQRDRVYPGNVVGWQFGAPAREESVAILIPEATPDHFKVIAYNLDADRKSTRLNSSHLG